MKRAITILSCVLAAWMAAAQNPSIIQNTKAIMQGVQANETRATNQALSVANPQTPAASTSAAKPSAPVLKTSSNSSSSSANAKTSAAKPSVVSVKAPAKVAPAVSVKPAPKAMPAKAAVPKVTATKVPAKPAAAPIVAKTAPAPAPVKTEGEAPKGPEKADGKWSMTGKRDPFISPVVYQTGPSNCASGKKCLEISAINLRGVVQSENGFIAVVTNNLNKAYFLRENDPVFDGYVVKITGDSIIFQETTQDKLGKTFTKEVVKKLTTPSV